MPLSHEFGIIEIEEREYLDYNPSKYKCISIDDELVIKFVDKCDGLKTFYNSYDRPGLGLAYYGNTLIKGQSLTELKEILIEMNKSCLLELIKLIDDAIKRNKTIIHYGI